MTRRYPQRHSGVPENHWSRITGGTESPGSTSFPRLQFPGPTPRHRMARLLVSPAPESGLPLPDSSWSRLLLLAPGSGVTFTLREPAWASSLSSSSGSSPSGPTGGAKDSLHRAEVRALRGGRSGVTPNDTVGFRGTTGAGLPGVQDRPIPPRSPRLQFLCSALRHHGSRLPETLVVKSGVPLPVSCHCYMLLGAESVALQEPVLSLVVIFFFANCAETAGSTGGVDQGVFAPSRGSSVRGR